MRIGLMLGSRREPVPLDVILRQVAQAEADGFDSVWLTHLPTYGYDALTMVALAGRQTERVELGTAVVPVYPFHPLALAKLALTAQAVSRGRLTLGIGVSHKPVVESAMGLSYEAPARYMREYVSILRPLLRGERVDFKGEVFRVKADISVAGASPCPIVIAALAPRMLRLAGELADGTVTWMGGLKAIEAHVAPQIGAAARDAGRPQPRVCVSLPMAVTDDVEDGRAHMVQEYQRYGQLTNYRRLLDVEGVEGPADVSVVGTEAQVEAQLRAFARAGATDCLAAITPVGDDADASVARTWACLRGLVGKV